MTKTLGTLVAVLAAVMVLAGPARSFKFKVCAEDVKVRKQLCAMMLRQGKDSLARLRFAQARDYFMKAVQADPTSMKAWGYYNRALILSLAWNYKVKGYLFAPSPAKTISATPGKTPAPKPAATAKPAPAKKPAQKPKPAAAKPMLPPPPEDEGC